MSGSHTKGHPDCPCCQGRGHVLYGNGRVGACPQCKAEPADTINHPPHYTATDVEPIDVIEAWGLSFCLGNTVKYVARAKHKGSELEDLKKARWYLEREISTLERNSK